MYLQLECFHLEVEVWTFVAILVVFLVNGLIQCSLVSLERLLLLGRGRLTQHVGAYQRQGDSAEREAPQENLWSRVQTGV